MSSSRIGSALKAARERRGWSREALAFHSGVSWSAITQIESGRRKDVRLTSLIALADALGVTIDYFVGRSRPSAGLFEHRVLPYESDDGFLSVAVPFVDEGLARHEPVLVVTTKKNNGGVRRALDGRADGVQLVDSARWYRSPKGALTAYQRFVDEARAAGATSIRIVGEPVWSGRSAAQVAAWTRYEALVNLVFADAPVTVVCPYDTRVVPAAVVADAHRTHPEVVGEHGASVPSPFYRDVEDVLLAE